MQRHPQPPGSAPAPAACAPETGAATSGELTALPRAPKRGKTSPKRGGGEQPLRWWVRGEPDALLAELLADPDAVLGGPASTPRARMGRKHFYHLGKPGEVGLFVKVFHPPPGPLHWLARLRRAKAWREAEVAARVRERGFAAAIPVAVGEERRAGLLRRSFSVTRELPARDLRTRLQQDAPCARRRRAWLAQFGELQRRLHEAGIDQDDTSPNNFLLAEEEAGCAWTLIDFERCRVGAVPLGWARRRRLLAKLARHGLGVSLSERLRFLRAYLGPAGDARSARRAAWREIERELVALRLRAARHAAHGAFQPGRHVAREGGAWWVRGRESASLLRAALPPREARAAWILAHQLERLGLPALAPARLDADGIAWVDPPRDPEPPPPERERRIARARRAFERCGRFTGEPHWLLADGQALLVDPRTFRLQRPGWRWRAPGG